MRAGSSSIARRYAVLSCEDAAKWDGFEELFKLAFSHADDSWDIFKCCAGDLPELHTVDRYTALYVSGSHSSAYEELPWIQQLCSWVQGFAQQQRKAKLLGICFGCQVLARALGGEVARNPNKVFTLKVEDITVQPALAAAAFYSRTRDDMRMPATPTLRLLESHGDQVTALPPHATVLASSPTAPFEMWSLGDGILAVQGHPEFSAQLVLDKIYPAMVERGVLSGVEAAESHASLSSTEPDNDFVLAVMRAFLTPRPPQLQTEPTASGELPVSVPLPQDLLAEGLPAAVADSSQLASRRAEQAKHASELQQQASIMTGSLQQMADASVGEMSNDLKLAEAVNEAARAHVQSLSASLNGWAPLQEEARRKQQALQQLWPCIPAVVQQLDELEATLQKLDRVSLDLEKAAKALAKAQRKQAAAL